MFRNQHLGKGSRTIRTVQGTETVIQYWAHRPRTEVGGGLGAQGTIQSGRWPTPLMKGSSYSPNKKGSVEANTQIQRNPLMGSFFKNLDSPSHAVLT